MFFDLGLLLLTSLGIPSFPQLFNRTCCTVEKNRALVKIGARSGTVGRSIRINALSYCVWNDGPKGAFWPFAEPSVSKLAYDESAFLARPGLLLVTDGRSISVPGALGATAGRRLAGLINGWLDERFGRQAPLHIPQDALPVQPACTNCGRRLDPARVDVHAMTLSCPNCEEDAYLTMDEMPLLSRLTKEDSRVPWAAEPEQTDIEIAQSEDDRMAALIPQRPRVAFRHAVVSAVLAVPAAVLTAWFVWEGLTPALLVATVLIWAAVIAPSGVGVYERLRRTFLAILPDSVVVTRRLLQWERTREFPRTPLLRARLAASQFKLSHTRCAEFVLSDGDGPALLRRVLKDPDARWLVFRVNGFLLSNPEASFVVDGRQSPSHLSPQA